MKVFGFTGHSGSGKTTLLIRLLPWLRAQGLTVSTLKQANVGFDIDHPGKDSYEHRAAGACEVLVASEKRWALMHEYRDEPPLDMHALLRRMSAVDLVLVEGFRHWPHPRVEVWRQALGREPLYPHDPRVLAVASPDVIPGLPLPLLALDDTTAIGSFLLERIGRP